jgi:broad specificity polyphosphatase/5'/3'-nucleotidase SurE
LLDKNPLYNVNIPAHPLGIRITRQGSTYFSDVFEEVEENMYLQTGTKIDDVCPHDETLDTVMTEKGYITLTPLLTTRTNLAVFEELKQLNM